MHECFQHFDMPIILNSFIEARHLIGYTHLNSRNHIDFRTNSIKTTKKTQIVSRRLAGIHRRQAVHARTKNTVKNLMSRLAAQALPLGDFWAETQKSRKTVRIHRIFMQLSQARFNTTYANLIHIQTTPLT